MVVELAEAGSSHGYIMSSVLSLVPLKKLLLHLSENKRVVVPIIILLQFMKNKGRNKFTGILHMMGIHFQCGIQATFCVMLGTIKWVIC